MAKQPQSQDSQFAARSDRAALSLRQSLIKSGRDIPESRAVEVEADGRPPAPLPPEGSYARQNIERQRRLAAQRPQPADDIQMQRQDPQATLEGDGNQPTNGQPQSDEDTTQISAHAQRRISQLSEDLRKKDQEYQQMIEDSKKNKESMGQLQAQLEALQQQHRQLLDQSLANMDPDTRAQVLLDGRLMEALAASEQRIMNQIMPHLAKFDRQGVDAEMRRLSAIYPGFNMDLHGPLIEAFRKGNPRCTVEQAFRAVAEPEELQLSPQVRASAVPPAVKPGNGRNSRWQPETRSDPEEELREEAASLKKLMSSTDPDDKSRRNAFLHDHLSKRLAHRLPG